MQNAQTTDREEHGGLYGRHVGEKLEGGVALNRIKLNLPKEE